MNTPSPFHTTYCSPHTHPLRLTTADVRPEPIQFVRPIDEHLLDDSPAASPAAVSASDEIEQWIATLDDVTLAIIELLNDDDGGDNA